VAGGIKENEGGIHSTQKKIKTEANPGNADSQSSICGRRDFATFILHCALWDLLDSGGFEIVRVTNENLFTCTSVSNSSSADLKELPVSIIAPASKEHRAKSKKYKLRARTQTEEKNL
jgi:hypothetical protein